MADQVKILGIAGSLRKANQDDVRNPPALRQAFVFLNLEAVVQPEVAIGNATERFDEQGNLKDETSKKLIRQLLQNLVEKTKVLKHQMKAAA